MVAARALARWWLDGSAGAPAGSRRVLIFGAGKAGVTVLSEIRAHPETGCHVFGLLDDDPQKRGQRMHGVRVLGSRHDLGALATRHAVDEVLIALPRAPGAEISAIFGLCHSAGVRARRVPALSELIAGRRLAAQIRDVRVEDLLSRAPVDLDATGLAARLEGRIVCVTGAGGSIGSELCRQIARFAPQAIVGFEHSEAALYEIEQELAARFPQVAFRAEIGDIRNRRRLDEIFAHHSPDSIFHAAAYKHVPMMESQVFEAVENNVFGTLTVVRAAGDARVRDFVLISSDKAVRPTNVMGATKRVAELIAQHAGYSMVRFGNVLGSSGSVIPRFRRQIEMGGPVTVTHPEMRRFFMTIPEAAQLVLEASAMGRGGEVFVLQMGQPVRIADLARQMILLAGLKPDEDIRIEYTGVRPGEKLYEEVSAIEEDTVATRHPQIRIFTGRDSDSLDLDDLLARLSRATEARDHAGVVLALKDLAPEYSPSATLLRRAFDRTGDRAPAYFTAKL
jgi:FlaA1/EpsC-like NDP-sugar epimerase